MHTADFAYDLPPELIATEPCARRQESRMLVVDVGAGTWEHRCFTDFVEYPGREDLVVLNNSKVIKARLPVSEVGGEVLLVEPLGPGHWLAMVRPGRKWRIGAVHSVAGTTARVLEIRPGGERVLEFGELPDLEQHGQMPLPPYLKRAARAEDESRYQTVYADPPGSVAAPTAGLHFTPEILQSLPHTFVTLHVGPGTFQPVKSEEIAAHAMHEERYEIPAATAGAINQASRIFAVGTTVVRVLESQPPGPLQPHAGRTAIFIYPPYSFQRIDALLTNFHLPCSTLLMLVSALAGRELILAAYAEAVRERYRFFSYGDCMLILRPRNGGNPV